MIRNSHAPDGLDQLWRQFEAEGWKPHQFKRLRELIVSQREAPRDVVVSVLEQLDVVKMKALALELAIMGASREGALNSYGDALAHVAFDLSRSIDDLEAAFASMQERDPGDGAV